MGLEMERFGHIIYWYELFDPFKKIHELLVDTAVKKSVIPGGHWTLRGLPQLLENWTDGRMMTWVGLTPLSSCFKAMKGGVFPQPYIL